jgi:hypothetical protein
MIMLLLCHPILCLPAVTPAWPTTPCRRTAEALPPLPPAGGWTVQMLALCSIMVPQWLRRCGSRSARRSWGCRSWGSRLRRTPALRLYRLASHNRGERAHKSLRGPGPNLLARHPAGFSLFLVVTRLALLAAHTKDPSPQRRPVQASTTFSPVPLPLPSPTLPTPNAQTPAIANSTLTDPTMRRMS